MTATSTTNGGLKIGLEPLQVSISPFSIAFPYYISQVYHETHRTYRVRDAYASHAVVGVLKMISDNYIYITIKLNNKCKLLNINNIIYIIYIYP